MGIATAMAAFSATAAAGQLLMGQEQQKQAEAAAKRDVAGLGALIEKGPGTAYSDVQAQTEAFDLVDEQTQRAVTEATVAAQEAGGAGVIGGVGNIIQAQQESALKTAIERSKEEARVDELVAAEKRQNQMLKYQGLTDLKKMELLGAQEAIKEAKTMKLAGMSGIMAGLGSIPKALESDRRYQAYQDNPNLASPYLYGLGIV